ncbi:hypothetical protein [Niastella yeongjuensis]|uniref:hypothetical protein n=1 Tax=Niastella yeongjuensis TaxID=354355 RepID=UPI0008C95149|nr:hypothetical protein [Niastella yeongjuensis]SEN75602.1 hypothetical protein SAMN05660816_01426 [Niastella yeongjuensis]
MNNQLAWYYFNNSRLFAGQYFDSIKATSDCAFTNNVKTGIQAEAVGFFRTMLW